MAAQATQISILLLESQRLMLLSYLINHSHPPIEEVLDSHLNTLRKMSRIWVDILHLKFQIKDVVGYEPEYCGLTG